MKIFLVSIAVAVTGYVLGLFAGIALVKLFSSPKPDKSVESVMTGFFVTGPVFAVLGFIGALVYQLLSRANR